MFRRTKPTDLPPSLPEPDPLLEPEFTERTLSSAIVALLSENSHTALTVAQLAAGLDLATNDPRLLAALKLGIRSSQIVRSGPGYAIRPMLQLSAVGAV